MNSICSIHSSYFSTQFSLMKFPSFLFLSFIGTFFTLTNCNQDLPSLRSVQDTFPENHFCKSSPFKVVSGEPGFIAQCGLQAMKILRLVAKRNHRTDLGESFKQSYAEFADKLSQMTYTGKNMKSFYSVFSRVANFSEGKAQRDRVNLLRTIMLLQKSQRS